MSSLSRANSNDQAAALPQPPRDNTVKLANLWERMAGKDESHVVRRNSGNNKSSTKGSEPATKGTSMTKTESSPSSITVLSSAGDTTFERAPSLGASGRMPPRPQRSGTRELINALERRCSVDADAADADAAGSNGTAKPPFSRATSRDRPGGGGGGGGGGGAHDGSDGALVRRLSSAEVDARAERAVNTAAVADMTELKGLVERMTRRVTDLEHKIEKMQASMPGVGDDQESEDANVGDSDGEGADD